MTRRNLLQALAGLPVVGRFFRARGYRRPWVSLVGVVVTEEQIQDDRVPRDFLLHGEWVRQPDTMSYLRIA